MTEREKESLERYMKRNAPLPREEVARIVMQIGDALRTAHCVRGEPAFEAFVRGRG